MTHRRFSITDFPGVDTENTFGILVARLQFFKRPIRASIETVQ